MLKHTLSNEQKQESAEKSYELSSLCGRFLTPLLEGLKQQLDMRLVTTLYDLVLVMILHRHRQQALLMSELGGELLGEAHAPAGSKRISNLLHSPHWQAEQISEELWRQGDAKVEQLNASNEEALVIWDESENEKPESLASEGLCAVRSSKAARLKRIKPGFFNPPGGRPIFVPGFHWIQVLVVGMKAAPRLAHLHWWTSRGEHQSDKRSEEEHILAKLAQAGAAGWSMSSTRALPVPPGSSASWRTPPLLFVLRWKQRLSSWWARMAPPSWPGNWCRAGGQWATRRSGMPGGGSNARWASSLCAPPCPSTSIRSGWWSPVPGPGKSPGIC